MASPDDTGAAYAQQSEALLHADQDDRPVARPHIAGPATSYSKRAPLYACHCFVRFERRRLCKVR